MQVRREMGTAPILTHHSLSVVEQEAGSAFWDNSVERQAATRGWAHEKWPFFFKIIFSISMLPYLYIYIYRYFLPSFFYICRLSQQWSSLYHAFHSMASSAGSSLPLDGKNNVGFCLFTLKSQAMKLFMCLHHMSQNTCALLYKNKWKHA